MAGYLGSPPDKRSLIPNAADRQAAIDAITATVAAKKAQAIAAAQAKGQQIMQAIKR